MWPLRPLLALWTSWAAAGCPNGLPQEFGAVKRGQLGERVRGRQASDDLSIEQAPQSSPIHGLRSTREGAEATDCDGANRPGRPSIRPAAQPG